MLCIKCNQDTPDSELYCRHCGTKLDLTFDQVALKMGKDIHSEKLDESERFFRWILIIVVFFAFSGCLFYRLWDTSLDPKVCPGYVPALDIPAGKSVIHSPLVIPGDVK